MAAGSAIVGASVAASSSTAVVASVGANSSTAISSVATETSIVNMSAIVLSETEERGVPGAGDGYGGRGIDGKPDEAV